MAETAERQRTVLRAPRVDFDLSALALGAFGWLAYQLSWPALASILAVPEVGGVPAWIGLRSAFFDRVLGWTGLPYTNHIHGLVGSLGQIRLRDGPAYDPQLPWWKYAVVGVWLLVLWSIVAGAISRVYAVRIARDESIGAGEGLSFSISNLKQFLLAPLFVAAAAALFLGLAAAAGAASAIPGAGPFLQIVMQPLALVAALVVLILAIGGIFGLPVMQAALATEKNGTLDAISRTFSYVFTKPVAYLVSVVLVTVVAGVIAAFGAALIAIAARAMMFGASWASDPSAPIDAARAIGGGIDVGMKPGGVLGWPQVEKFDGLPVMWVYVAWAITALATIVVNGYVLSYFVGGLTDTYFLLRREVDGIDDTEVYVEGAEASLGEPLAGEPAGGGKP